MQLFESKINSVIEQAYPQQGLVVELMPIEDLTIGHFCIDLTKQIASRLKLSPDQIAERLLPFLKDFADYNVSYSNGYLNFKLATLPADALDIFKQTYISKKISIATVFSDNIFNNFGLIRFIAQPYLQAYLACVAGLQVVFVKDQQEISLKTANAVLSAFWDDFLRLKNKQYSTLTTEQIEHFILSFIEQSDENSFLWLAPQTLNQKIFNRIFHVAKNSSMILCCPEASLFEAVDEEGIDNIGQLHSLNLLYLLATNELGRNIDWNVAGNDENSNLAWYINASLQRWRRFEEMFLSEINNVTNDLPINELLIRSLQMPLFSKQAILNGKIQLWHTACVDLLNRANRFFNEPGNRLLLEQRVVAQPEKLQIMAVVYRALCSIIK